tara:strand:- start:354 stop:1043 length:690 start_codon:yes stop_codon:yes gene_type:complete
MNSKQTPAKTQPAGELMTSEQKRQRDLVLYHPAKCFQHSKKLKRVTDALTVPAPRLSELAKSHGREWIIGYVTLWLLDLNDYSTVKRKMSDAQIERTAERIYDEYPLKITDLTLFFDRCKDEYYEPSFESVTGPKVLRWLQEYFDERCEAAAYLTEKEKKAFNANTDKMHPDVAKKMFEGVGTSKVDHRRTGGGLGSRKRNEIKRKSPIVAQMFEEAAKAKKDTNQEPE